MKPKKIPNSTWEMTTAEMREATKYFEDELSAEKNHLLNVEERALWRNSRAKSARSEKKTNEQVI